ncbi:MULTISPECIES: ankyrin repeat domain-containing protein [unclassified Chelatococcus]|uniref:ankyrin repeat domain-containing protein n=1 Tax=unclassified Chelatococcus TaxID=2638111 RepID=UPI001BCCF23B|nr:MULTISPECIES: ankyrin repeat domain-containing protein [unclassified Chelatococcus]CAH1652176.1 Ankyrin repeat protein [Hyphomicrobiales bacterium]MBS7739951.1 ankyrin repeat domain-containing protein [Chelatococcus sp. HY11]MBX3545655.1 ankyrin repeat domain-containing protein [Chelatococcus sp.]MCO5078749.1 ankyrin repeat domain-containing protein [Chelatococcus sp.]CAH1686066.1 Ankyrin repeat protein [Hyphomicrobiales bacterium]
MANNPGQADDAERRRLHAAFLEAVNIGDVDKVRQSLANPAIDINYAEPGTGLTPLHIAAGRNAVAVLRLLLATERCDLGMKDAQGRTAAIVAVTVGRNPAVGRYLADLQHGAGIAVPAQRRRPGEQTDSG